jgi:hypothetical protein
MSYHCCILVGILLWAMPTSAVAQRPTAEPVHQASPFWPIDAATGRVEIKGISPFKGQGPDEVAQHVRSWLTVNTSSWEEWAGGGKEQLRFVAYLEGVHPGVVLRFVLTVTITGKKSCLSRFEVGAPTGEGRLQWSDLHRLLDDPDFRPDVRQFQARLQQALPSL